MEDPIVRHASAHYTSHMFNTVDQHASARCYSHMPDTVMLYSLFVGLRATPCLTKIPTPLWRLARPLGMVCRLEFLLAATKLVARRKANTFSNVGWIALDNNLNIVSEIPSNL